MSMQGSLQFYIKYAVILVCVYKKKKTLLIHESTPIPLPPKALYLEHSTYVLKDVCSPTVYSFV